MHAAHHKQNTVSKRIYIIYVIGYNNSNNTNHEPKLKIPMANTVWKIRIHFSVTADLLQPIFVMKLISSLLLHQYKLDMIGVKTQANHCNGVDLYE